MALKIAGRIMNGPKTGLLVIPRDDGDIAFKYVAITDDSEFDKLCPRPKPQIRSYPDGRQIPDLEDPGFKAGLNAWVETNTNWYFLKSTAPTGIEWDTVVLTDPATYANWRNDLKAAGFSVSEIRLIFDKFLDTNTISEESLTEARNRFLASQAASKLAQLPSPNGELTLSESGELVNGSI